MPSIIGLIFNAGRQQHDLIARCDGDACADVVNASIDRHDIGKIAIKLILIIKIMITDHMLIGMHVRGKDTIG